MLVPGMQVVSAMLPWCMDMKMTTPRDQVQTGTQKRDGPKDRQQHRDGNLPNERHQKNRQLREKNG